jgi:hypothetical protein
LAAASVFALASSIAPIMHLTRPVRRGDKSCWPLVTTVLWRGCPWATLLLWMLHDARRLRPVESGDFVQTAAQMSQQAGAQAAWLTAFSAPLIALLSSTDRPSRNVRNDIRTASDSDSRTPRVGRRVQ